jgi:hypothetical protein
MPQMGPGLFPTLEPNLKQMSASRISRNGAVAFLVAANVLATPLFLYFSSQFWAAPGESGPWNAPRDASLLGYLALPLLATAVFSNIFVIPRVVTELLYRKDFRLLLVWCACIATLFSAYIYDWSRKPNDYIPHDDDFHLGHESKVK